MSGPKAFYVSRLQQMKCDNRPFRFPSFISRARYCLYPLVIQPYDKQAFHYRENYPINHWFGEL